MVDRLRWFSVHRNGPGRRDRGGSDLPRELARCSSPKAILIALLGAAGIAFVVFWIRQARGATGRRRPTLRQLGIGIVTDFFDMLGIGSFAPTTSLYKLGGVVADENIPGTLNVGHMIPTFAEAVISILIIAVDVEAKTLTLMIGAGDGRRLAGRRRGLRLAAAPDPAGDGGAAARRGGDHGGAPDGARPGRR